MLIYTEAIVEELRISTFGGLAVRRGDQPVSGLTARKATALLVYLACSDQLQPRESLAELLWQGRSHERALSNLRTLLSDLRWALEPYLLINRDALGIDPAAPVWLDTRAFAAHLRAGRREDAVALYRGDFLDGFYLHDAPGFESWVTLERERYRRLARAALHELAARDAAAGRIEAGLGFARRLLQLDPLDEAAHRQLMALYAQAGRRSAAVRQYRECLRLLEEELGISPAAETIALYQRIRAKGLIPETRKETPSAPVSTPLPAFLQDQAEPRLSSRPPFVARQPELTRLAQLLDAALEGRGGVAFVTGGPGRGKSALMEAFAQRAMDAHPDLLVAVGHCDAYSGAGDPYLPFRDLLGMLSGDVEARWQAGGVSREHAQRLWRALPVTAQALAEHGAPLIDALIPGAALFSRAWAAAPADAPWLPLLQALVQKEGASSEERAQSQLFEAYTSVLHGVETQHPLLLLLDDLQWVDSASAGLLFHLGRRLLDVGGRLMILGAYRPEEVALGGEDRSAEAGQRERHSLEKVLAEFKRSFGDVWLDLTRADEVEGRDFVDALLDIQPNRLGEPFRQALFQHTGGHPLFTLEMLRALQERGDLTQATDGRWVEGTTLDWERLPARVEGVIQERVGRLGEGLRDILSIASVEGEVFTAQVVAAVQATDVRQLLRTLSRQLEGQHRLVRELETLSLDGQSLYRYRFSHVLFQRYLYDDLSQGERMLLHGEVAQALEALYEGHTNEIAVPLAHHYARAAEGEKAIHYSQQAGDQARLAYALDAAVGHYQVALALQKELGDHDGAARTLMKLGLTHHNAFQFQAARQAYDAGFALWRQAPTSASTPIDQPAPHALRSILNQPPRTLDPTIAYDTSSMLLIDQLFSGLLELTPELEAVPDVARSWEVSPDGRRYLFHLRDDVRWSDGEPVTAADFEFAWKRILDPVTRSEAASLLYDIQGARAFHQGESPDPDRVAVQARDRWSLEVVLEQPAAYFPSLLTLLYPVPRHVVVRHGDNWTDPEQIVTNGPFRLESWQPNGSFVLVRNPDYHGQFPGNLQRVRLFAQPEDLALRLQMYAEDRLDVLRGILIGTESWTRSRYPGEWIEVPVLRTWILWFNLLEPPFNDRRVRRALVLATDRVRFADGISQGWISPATGGVVPPGMPGHAPGIALPYDPRQARRLLAEAGYTGRGDRRFPHVDFLGLPSHRAPIHALAQQWQENLDIEITFQEVPAWDELYKRLITDPPHLSNFSWTADYPDPDTYMRVFISRHMAGWQHETYQRLIAQARQLTDQTERLRLYRRAEHILVEEVPIMPLWYSRHHLLIKPWVRGHMVTPMGLIYWKNAIIEPHTECATP